MCISHWWVVYIRASGDYEGAVSHQVVTYLHHSVGFLVAALTCPDCVAVSGGYAQEAEEKGYVTRNEQLSGRAEKKEVKAAKRRSKRASATQGGKGKVSKKRKLLAKASPKKARKAMKSKAKKAKEAREKPEVPAASAVPKAKAAAKAKGKAKAAASAPSVRSPKAKAKAAARQNDQPPAEASQGNRPGRRPRRTNAEAVLHHPLRDDLVTRALMDFAKSFHEELDEPGPEPLKRLKEAINTQMARTLQRCKLNKYWSRNSFGVTEIQTGKDINHFSFNAAAVPRRFKLAVAARCADLAAA